MSDGKGLLTPSATRMGAASGAGSVRPSSRSSIVRPVVMLVVNRRARSTPGSATSSVFLRRNQVSSSLPSFPDFTSRHSPLQRSPWSSNAILPLRRPSDGSPIGSQVPWSHTMTWPPPYSPFGIVPSNVR